MNRDLQYYSKEFTFYTEQLQRIINSIGLKLISTHVDLQKEVYLTLLNRIGVNISSINHLSKVFYEENVSSSIALLFRACISDILLGNYLLMFKSDSNTFSGEIKIKEMEFLKYANKVSQIEQELLSDSIEECEMRKKEILNILKEDYSDLIEDSINNVDFKIKSVKKIRIESNSNPELFGEAFNKHPTEDYMFDRLLGHKSEFKNYYSSVYALWRYFAQFQHYSFTGRHFIADNKENFLYYFIQSLKDCYYFVFVLQDEIFQVAVHGFEANMLKVLELYKEYKPNN
jgi:hypothetical protein